MVWNPLQMPMMSLPSSMNFWSGSRISCLRRLANTRPDAMWSPKLNPPMNASTWNSSRLRSPAIRSFRCTCSGAAPASLSAWVVSASQLRPKPVMMSARTFASDGIDGLPFVWVACRAYARRRGTAGAVRWGSY